MVLSEYFRHGLNVELVYVLVPEHINSWFSKFKFHFCLADIRQKLNFFYMSLNYPNYQLKDCLLTSEVCLKYVYVISSRVQTSDLNFVSNLCRFCRGSPVSKLNYLRRELIFFKMGLKYLLQRDKISEFVCFLTSNSDS